MKKYIETLYVRKHTFTNGGSVLNLDFKAEDFLKEIATLQPNDNGYVRITIAEKQADKQEEGKPTHYAYENTWRGNAQAQPQHANASAAQEEEQINVTEVPF